MNIHEYQANELLQKFGVATTRGKVASTPEEAEAIARELGDVDLATGRLRVGAAAGLVVKAQIHAGGEERELSKTDSKAASTSSNRRRKRAKLRIKCSAKL